MREPSFAQLEIKMNFTLRPIAIPQFLVLFIATSLAFADDDAKGPTYHVEVMSVQTIMVDANDRPIAGVKATVRGLCCIEFPHTLYPWPSENIGKLQESQSKADGSIEFRYPVKFGVPGKWQGTSAIAISFSHPNYVAQWRNEELAQFPEKIKLESGCKVHLSAIDEAKKPVERFFPIVTCRHEARMWEYTPGNAKTGCLSQGKLRCLLVSPRASGTLFSKLLEFETDPDKMVSIDNILLQPGKRVFGKLPDYVPRPIVDGNVSIDLGMTLDAPLGGRETVQWTDITPISEDGTFEFQSVPGPAQVQVIAICRGWIIRSPKAGRVEGQMFDLRKDQSELEVAFEMEQTGDVRIELSSVDGEKIVGATVSTWPNKSGKYAQGWIASTRRSIDYVECSLRGETYTSTRDDTNRYCQISDNEGVVTLRDVPVGSEELIFVSHPNYDLPRGIEEHSDAVQISSERGRNGGKFNCLTKTRTVENQRR